MTRRTLLTLAGVCLLPRLSFAQLRTEDFQRGASFLDVANLVNEQHPFAPMLWWLMLPQRTRGESAWIDLCRNARLIPTNMSSVENTGTSGYGRSTIRAGGFVDVRLDNNNDYLTMPKIPAFNLTQGSLVVSAYRTAALGGDVIVSLGDGSANSDNSYTLQWPDTTNSINAQFIASAGYLLRATTASVFPSGAWYQFVVTTNAQGNAMYANGQPLTLTYATGSAATASWWSAIYAAITTFDVGRLNCVNFPGYLGGRVDDIRIYPRALTAKEVLALYTNTRLGYPGLLRRLPLTAAPAAVAATVRKRPGGRIY